MSHKFAELDLSGLKRYPFATRKNLVTLEQVAARVVPGAPVPSGRPELEKLAADVLRARSAGKPVIFAFGGHVIKVGMSRIVAQLIESGLITCVATNGSGMIHDYELAKFGRTSEDVAGTLHDGTFGFALETGRDLNALTVKAFQERRGLGETVGEALSGAEPTVLGAAWKKGIPATVHLAIGTDIIHTHPDFDGAAAGETTTRDFRILAAVVAGMGDGGVFINAGSAVVMPEVFLKSVTAAVNLGHSFHGAVTAVFDQISHYRPNTNVLDRPARDGGRSYQVIGRHESIIPEFAALLIKGA